MCAHISGEREVNGVSGCDVLAFIKEKVRMNLHVVITCTYGRSVNGGSESGMREGELSDQVINN